jgi:hypothetical protein
MTDDPALISRAIVVWTGRGVAARPVREDARLIAAFGVAAGSALIPVVKEIAADFYASGAPPEISDEAVAALDWCYTYDHA